MTEGINLNSESSWTAARSYAVLLNPIPASVSQAIIALWKNYSGDRLSGQLSVTSESYNSIKRLERSSKLKTPLYFAATSLYPEKFAQLDEDDSTSALLQILTPGLFAALLGLVYFHKRIAKICENRDWSSFSKEYVLNMELGYLVGSSIPKLGPTIGTLLGGIRFAALAVFYIRSEDQFARYRNLKKKKFDLRDEHERWGCDHAQISAYLLNNLGIRGDTMQMAQAIRCEGTLPDGLPEELQVWNAAIHWIETIRDRKNAPSDPKHIAILQPSKENLQTLNQKIEQLLAQGSSFAWMLKAAKVQEPEPSEE